MKIGIVYGFIGFCLSTALHASDEDEQCGLSGSIGKRIKSCAVRYPIHSVVQTEDERSEGAPLVVWRLVSVMDDGFYSKLKRQTWFNESMNLLWSDRIVVGKSGGYVSHASAQGLCEDDQLGNSSKGDLDLAFRVPTIEEFRTAHAQELKSVLPGIADGIFSYKGSEIVAGGGTTALHRGFAFWASDTETDEDGDVYAWSYDPFPFPLGGKTFRKVRISDPDFTPGRNVMCVAHAHVR